MGIRILRMRLTNFQYLTISSSMYPIGSSSSLATIVIESLLFYYCVTLRDVLLYRGREPSSDNPSTVVLNTTANYYNSLCDPVIR